MIHIFVNFVPSHRLPAQHLQLILLHLKRLYAKQSKAKHFNYELAPEEVRQRQVKKF